MSNATPQIAAWNDPELEAQILDSISLTVPWSVVETFSRLVRLSGSPEERQAFEELATRLGSWGVPYTLYEPEAFISIPIAATVRTLGEGGKSFRAKTVAMAVSTGGQEISGELVYLGQGGGAADFWEIGVDTGGRDVRGKIVLTEGMAGPGSVRDLMATGALAGIFINPGEAIHEGICTTIWGAPDLDSIERLPNLPVATVNHTSGQELIAAARHGARVALSTTVDTGWRRIPVLVAEIQAGGPAAEEFVLLHGHLDSWHVGVGDNATGDATMLELARVFQQHRDQLQRSLRVAWWSGHSHGRYAGSTWYSDNFAIDLAKNCVAQVNCDSPGCRWANTFNELNAMPETVPFVEAVVSQTSGITPQTERPARAGDYSFNDIGISSYFMLSSTMSQELRDEKGYYPVGGCGANIEWHTEGDTMEIADRDNLLRDMRVYAAAVFRNLNAPLCPFDWTQTTAEFRQTLRRYQEAAGGEFDFSPSLRAVEQLEAALVAFYRDAPGEDGLSAGDERARRFNFVQRRLARLLIPVNYSRMPAFYHDPAVEVPALPDLAPALSLPRERRDVGQRGVIRAHLTRGQNRLIWTLQQARELVEGGQ